MKTIIIGFSKPKAKFVPLSWLIRAFMKTRYSHVFLEIPFNNLNRRLIFQASGSKVNFISRESFEKEHLIVAEFKITISDEKFKKLVQNAIDLVGEHYSILQLVNTAIYKLFKINPFDNEIKGWDCSKLVASTLATNLDLDTNIDLDVVTPKDIFKYLTNLNLENK